MSSPLEKPTIEPSKKGKLRIFFRGLCVFYTHKPILGKSIQNATDSPPITVLLPDARIPEKSIPGYKYNLKDPLFPHIPLLSIPKELLNPLPISKPHKFVIEDEFVFPLTKHVIDIEQIGDGLKKTRDFENFIPNLKEYAKDRHGQSIGINPNLIDPNKIRSHNKLSALIQIKEGIVSVPSSQNTEPRRSADFVKTVFDKDNYPQPDEKAQMLTNCVCWDIGVEYRPKSPLSTKLSTDKFAELIRPIVENSLFKKQVISIAKVLAYEYSKKESLAKTKKVLYNQLDEEYLKVDPTNFQKIFKQIFRRIALEKFPDKAKEIAEKIAQLIAEILTHKYYPFTIKLKKTNTHEELVLNLQLKVKIDKDANTVIDAVPGNIFITNMPLEGISMHTPFQKERDLDFALSYSVLKNIVPKPYMLPRRIPSPDELNDQEQTLPPLICSIVSYSE